jgi:hypothetical protein
MGRNGLGAESAVFRLSAAEVTRPACGVENNTAKEGDRHVGAVAHKQQTTTHSRWLHVHRAEHRLMPREMKNEHHNYSITTISHRQLLLNTHTHLLACLPVLLQRLT